MMALTYVQAWTQEHQNLAFFFILCLCLIQGCLHMVMPMLMCVLASLVRTELIVQCTWIIPHCILFVIHFKGVISLKTTSLWWCPPVSDPKHFVDMTMSMINAGTRHQHHPDQFRFLRNCPPTPSRRRFSLAAGYFWQPWLDDHISSLLSRAQILPSPSPFNTCHAGKHIRCHSCNFDFGRCTSQNDMVIVIIIGRFSTSKQTLTWIPDSFFSR